MNLAVASVLGQQEESVGNEELDVPVSSYGHGNFSEAAPFLQDTGLRASLANSRQTQKAGGSNFDLGPVGIGLDTGMEVEFNDNVELSNQPLADIILRPRLGLQFQCQLTEHNLLQGRLSVSYEKYLKNVDRDRSGLDLDPDTFFNFKTFVGDFVITLYDRPDIRRQVETNGTTLANVGDYEILENTVGLSVLWDLNKVILVGGFQRRDQMSLNSSYESIDQTSYTFTGMASLQAGPATQVGIKGNMTWTDYWQPILNDGSTMELGLFVDQQLTTYTSVYLEGGLQVYEFKDTGTPLEGDLNSEFANNSGDIEGTLGGGNYIGPYGLIGIANRLNRYVNQTLSIGLQTQSSSISNFTRTWQVIYDANWRVNSRVDANFGLLYSLGEISGSSQGGYQQYGVHLGLDFDIVKHWQVYTRYSFDARLSQSENYSYKQNKIIIGCEYTF